MAIEIIKSTKSSTCKTRPKLSICIPTWNRGLHLEEQISNITKSITDDIEIVVVDNGSIDSTWEFLKNVVSSNNCKISCFRNTLNLGADVNYLRAIEFANGEWCWLMGDDDPVDFNILPYLLKTTKTINTDIILLIESKGHINFDRYTPTFISGLGFLDPSHDSLGIRLQKVGHTLCKTDPAHEILRHAYNIGIGNLHSYLHIYAALLLKKGINVISVDIILPTKSLSNSPRWNIIRGHIGAWKATIASFPNHKIQALNRERRTRSYLLIHTVAGTLNENMKVSKDDTIWMLKSFSLKFKIYLLLTLIIFIYLYRFRHRIIKILNLGSISQFHDLHLNNDVGY